MNTSKKHTGYWIDKYVQENSGLRLAERIILGDIITVHKSSGKYFKSNDALSKITGLSKRAVQDVLKSLKDKGYINEPKQIRSSEHMTIRRLIAPNIAFAKKMYKILLEPIKNNVLETEITVQLDANQGAVLSTSGCGEPHTESTLENNRIHIVDNSLQDILSEEETKIISQKESKNNDWFDELITSGVHVDYMPSNPTVISEVEVKSYQKKKLTKVYKANQSGNGEYCSELEYLRDCIT